MNGYNENERYFAAANSYKGFISYFDRLFNSRDYERIYVLKGGPGTGKSSLMRRISSEMSAVGCVCKEILCSSDPKSLDGIIIYYNGKKIAVLDGTAPHERDAKIPGVVDEIINLGSCWDSGWLRAIREKIEPLCAEKSKAYSTAYSYLKIAGNASDFIYSVFGKVFDKSKAKIKAERIFEGIKGSNAIDYDTLLVSSFGRDGDISLDTLKMIAKKTVSVGNNEYLSALFLNYCYNELKQKAISFTHLPYALTPEYTECIFIHEKELLLCYGKDGDINTDELCHPLSIEKEQIKCAEAIIDIAKDEAKRWFNIGSDFHFRLEDIYSQAMNFDEIDRITEEKIKEIRFILDL